VAGLGKRIMRVDDEFSAYVDNIHDNFMREYGIDVPRTKITKLATEKLRAFDFEKDMKSSLINKRRRRQIIIEI
jgi:hypothetical protein